MNKIVTDWILKHEQGKISNNELLDKLFYHITVQPDETAAVLSTLRNQDTPSVRSLVDALTDLLSNRDKKR